MFDVPQTLTIRTKSGGPKLRAGLVLGSATEWAEHEIERTVDGFKKLLALAQDPAVTAHAQDEEGEWHPLPPATELDAGIKAMALMQAAPAPQPFDFGQGAASVSEMDLTDTSIRALGAGTLPTAGPMLEREERDTTPPQSVGGEGTEEDQTQTLDAAQEAAASGAEQGTPAPDTPDAKVEGDAKAEPEA